VVASLLVVAVGQTSFHSDCRVCTFAGRTLVDQLEAHHLSWAAYLEGLPHRCSTVPRQGAYTEAVDPFMHAAARIREDPSRCDRVLPFRRFHADLTSGRLPTVTIVAGPQIRRGRDPTGSTHYSRLRSIEAAYGLALLGHAGDPATAAIPALADPSPDSG
jgi:hypothetical protein